MGGLLSPQSFSRASWCAQQAAEQAQRWHRQAGAQGSHSSTIHCDLLVLLLLMSRKVTEIWVAAGRVGQCRVQGQQAAALGRSRLHAQPRLVPS